jgi:hypothetical protein
MTIRRSDSAGACYIVLSRRLKMAVEEHPPEKIDIDRGPGRFPAYASLYRFGRPDGPAR